MKYYNINQVKYLIIDLVEKSINISFFNLYNNYSLVKNLQSELITKQLNNCDSYKIVLKNIDFLSNIICRYLSSTITIEKFISTDNEGLIDVVFKYNYQENYQNLSYISRWVRNTLTKIIAYND